MNDKRLKSKWDLVLNPAFVMYVYVTWSGKRRLVGPSALAVQPIVALKTHPQRLLTLAPKDPALRRTRPANHGSAFAAVMLKYTDKNQRSIDFNCLQTHCSSKVCWKIASKLSPQIWVIRRWSKLG